MHRQIKIVAVLLIVQGGLEAAMGLFYCILGPIVSDVMSTMPASPSTSGGSPPPPPELMTAMYVGIGLAVLVVGGLKIAAGIFNLKLRGRILSYVALGSGLVSALTCYCLPTALALGIYGLIVLLNGKSGEAFAYVESGMTPADALNRIDGLVPMGGFGNDGWPPAPPPGPPPPPPYPGA
jgi:hypothetical protein